MTWRIDQADCIDWLRAIAPESVDLVITDPAYESLEKHRSHGTTTRLTNDWFAIFPNTRFPDLMTELYRVLKTDAHCYVYCDAETMFVIKPVGEAAGFKFWKPLVWDKVSIGMGYHYRARYEVILFFEKGHRKLNDLGIADIIRCDRVRDLRAYPTEKPVPVSTVLVNQSSNPGEWVIDPFAGSGSVGVAALLNDRRFAGCDVSPEAVAIGRGRLKAIDDGRR